MTAASGEALERCLASGGVALFPADTVYGLGCDARDEAAVERLYSIKERARGKAAAVMFGDLETALEAVGDLEDAEVRALRLLMPGPVTALVTNRRQSFPLAGVDDPRTLGIRVPDVPLLADLRTPMLQSSANRSGGAEASRLQDVDPAVRAAVDLEIDGGTLPGTASTVVDLRGLARGKAPAVLREGAVPAAVVLERLAAGDPG